MALKKYCARAGCNCLIPITQRYCPRHLQTNTERNKEYDQTRRDQKAKAFYNSVAWKHTRDMILSRDNHIDIYLYVTERRIVKASLVHHIIELREDYTKRLDPGNLISVSEETHEKTIKKAYSNEETKKQMQTILRKAINEYRELSGGGGA